MVRAGRTASDGSEARSSVAAVLALTVLAALVPTTGGMPADASDADLAIYNGEPASIDDYPYVAFVQTSIGSCTGSVISPSWILTAAHCFASDDPAGVLIGLGSDTLSAGFPEVVAARRVVIHPDYEPDFLSGDLALVQLSSPTTTLALPLVPAGFADPVGARAVITGWGLLDNEPVAQETDDLMWAEVPILDDAVCTGRYGFAYDPATFVCAGGEGRDACAGDSGGPLIIEHRGEPIQVGLVAHGEPCGAWSSTIGAYTSVTAYRSWIDTVIDAAASTEPKPDVRPDPEPWHDPLPVTDPDPEHTPSSFTDVITGSTHADNIERVAAAGIAGGYGDGRFGPADAVTRGQMATFLARSLELSDPGGEPFDDVPDTHTHGAGIRAVAAAGVAGGFTDGTYRPAELVSRAQMATFLTRALGSSDPGVRYFLDVTAANVHSPGIQAVAAEGVAGGFNDGRYGPAASVTRAQMATFLARAFLDAPRIQPPESIPSASTQLGQLIDACTDGGMAACDDLYVDSEPGSSLQAYADTCGYRQPLGTGRWCVDVFGRS